MTKNTYYAIIPADIRYDSDICSSAKLLYGEISALCHEKGYCWATNNYFASLYSVSTRSTIRWINQLKAKKYISSQLIYRKDSKEVLERRIRLYPQPTDTFKTTCGQNIPNSSDKNSSSYRQPCPTVIDKNGTDNSTDNIIFNNTNNITTNCLFDKKTDVLCDDVEAMVQKKLKQIKTEYFSKNAL